MKRRADGVTCGGCALSAAGAIGAPSLWLSLPRTRRHLGGGFENEGMDWTVLLTELPFVVLGGALLPLLALTLLVRLTGRGRPRPD
ncbi:hypothetical protein [Streptomyces griseorubiginosus]|uniref:hypothetical protein n=1 Tax=Streptomyces griseorubiginosus TaxID=67304 RepID=UPI000F4BD4E6|nr:hypothetical protein [Streptomyces griseorubiginosus]WUB45488.1 hypothetical protein OHN19_19880 [Streptomyces griseorubiginosus]WUB54006.1 hypothetical protein OG942_19880 [Streptomyces griseorubiginosus]